MANMTKKQLADALSKALFGDKYIDKDNEVYGFERLGYVSVKDSASDDDHQPVMLYVDNTGVELNWMFDKFHGTTDVSSFLRGMIHAVEPSLIVEDADTRYLVFGYTGTG